MPAELALPLELTEEDLDYLIAKFGLSLEGGKTSAVRNFKLGRENSKIEIGFNLNMLLIAIILMVLVGVIIAHYVS
jgi:hypothetical protein